MAGARPLFHRPHPTVRVGPRRTPEPGACRSPMSRALRFTFVVLAGLGLLVLASSFFVSRTLKEWVDRDLVHSGSSAVAGARDKLRVTSWITASTERLRALLTDVTHDERRRRRGRVHARRQRRRGHHRVAGARCRARWRYGTCATPPTRRGPSGPTGTAVESRAVQLYLSALPVIERRQADWRDPAAPRSSASPSPASGRSSVCSIGTFAVLACAASLLTVVVRRACRGGAGPTRSGACCAAACTSPSSSPLKRRARSGGPAERRARARRHGRPWTPQRLKDSLRDHLLGERVVVLANREPYIHDFDTPTAASTSTIRPAGLVTALEPVMRACSGVWVAHGSGTADRETVDSKDHRARAAGRGRVPAPARVAEPRRKSRATTTASRTRASGRSVTSRTRGRCSARPTGRTTRR